MEAKGSFSMVLLIIIAILALALAGLTGYVFFFAGPTKSADATKQHEITRPADTDLIVKKMFENKTIFNLKSTDDKKVPVIQANIELVYLKKVSGIKSVDEKIKAFDGAIKELIISYFQNLTPEEARNLQADEKVKEKSKKDMTRKINELLSSSEKEYKDIVYTVNFIDWFVQ